MATPAVWVQLLIFVDQCRFKGTAMQIERDHIGGGEPALRQIRQEQFIDHTTAGDSDPTFHR
jgi:hypothetical protein